MAYSISPYHRSDHTRSIPDSVCVRIPPKWREADLMARSSVGKLQLRGADRGCGILIGIDRLLVPAHVISSTCTQDLSVNFYSTDGQMCTYTYDVLNFLIINHSLDFAVLQLGRCWNRFPGQNHPFPGLNYENFSEQFLLGRFDGGYPYGDLVQNGYACHKGNFCSFADTDQGCSGSGYFNSDGSLFAMHLSRSNDRCSHVPQGERKAILISTMMFSSNLAYYIFSLRKCAFLCPPQNPYVCLPYSYSSEQCFFEEKKTGGRPAYSGNITINGRTHQVWEWRPSNCAGAGPRGLTVSLPHQRAKVTYVFDLNPHDISGYGNHEEELYKNAAQAFKNIFGNGNGAHPQRFVFQSYLRNFTASFEKLETYGKP